MKKAVWNEMTMGVCYYPEHWDESLWEDDLNRMKEMGISVIRIAEFAWSKFERTEGVLDFSFFDHFLDLCLKVDMKAIFGTPTATPPAWLTEKYPEVLNARIDGALYRHGERRHYNYNSPVYQKLCENIVTQLAIHYGKHPVVTGWQIDNELNCEICEFYSEADHLAFRKFLIKKYGDLDSLNKAWGTTFWNQTYTDWEQVYLPRLIVSQGQNPHQQLDYYRFISESALAFCNMQARILRKYISPDAFITTNGRFSYMDNHKMQKESLDVYTYDSYPSFAFGLDRNPQNEGEINDRWWSKNLSEVRSICPHFGIMEQQSGANGWTTRLEGPAPRPGQLSLWAIQSVAHGADFISFFRFRTCTMGTEIYWHGILDYDNRDNRKVAEVKSFYKKFKSLNQVCGADFVASFAVMKDYDNEWDNSVDIWHARLTYASENAIYKAAQLNHIPVDFVYYQEGLSTADLLKYPVIIYPHPVIIDEERANLLKEYVSQGGTLIMGCRSGYKDLTGQCVMMPQPGLLQPLTGTDIHDFTFTSKAEEDTYALLGNKQINTPVFNDILTPLEGTRVLATYGNSYYKGEAALTIHQVGKGQVIHFGSTFSETNIMEILKCAEVKTPFSQILYAPSEVELVLRRKDNCEYIFVLNYLSKEMEIELFEPLYSMFEEIEMCGKVTLPAYGTAVYKRINI